MDILIADDNLPSRVLLARLLSKLGYSVTMASDGKEAWEILQKSNINFVITDWIMPEMDGLELCKRIRSADLGHYVYIVILTSKEEKSEMIEGLEAGADDFIVKPYDRDELFVKIRIGERILQLEKSKEEQNRKLADTYAEIKKDLEAAAKIQLSLLPKSDAMISGVEFDWLFMPAAFMAGDIFNYFWLVDDYIGFYLLDVAGHGIPSALLSITLSRYLSPIDNQDSPLKKFLIIPPYYEYTRPKDVVEDLNQRFQASDDSMQYFTMVYGVINARTGQVNITQAGHPSPIKIEKNGSASFIGSGGFPVGIFPEATYEEHEFYLESGDRFILYSDGIIECPNDKGIAFSTERFTEIIKNNKGLSLHSLITDVEKYLKEWKGGGDFDDDISLLAFEMK
ncbi:MAG: response regulator [Desulfatiglans sp.]|jgi:sigma-B regulation protein RsbU (phosphoserine phosphatase)|nr:response regulator [Desulfatiglans sp.]